MAWQDSDNVLSFRDEARANNFPLVDTATWLADSQTLFPKSLILDVNLVAIAAFGVVGLSSINVTGFALTITFADVKSKFSANASVTVSLAETATEYERPIYDTAGRYVGVVVLDVASAKTATNITQAQHNFDPIIHAIVPSRCAMLSPDNEQAVVVDGVKFFGRIPVIAEGSLRLNGNGLNMVGRPFANMTGNKWTIRRRSLTKLNGIKGQDAQGAILQNIADGTQDALRVAIRDGGIHFSLAGLE